MRNQEVFGNDTRGKRGRRGDARWHSHCCGWLAVLLLGTPGAASERVDGARKGQPVEYMILVTGGELLEGVYADGHTFFLTQTLRPLGLRCVGSMSVDDKPADIKKALGFAMGRVKLVIVTGGLGPTDNDVTRETLADFTGIALCEHPQVLQEMRRRFGVAEGQLRANLRQQTQVPVRGTYLKNANGSAVGLVFESDQGVIVALPGPPRELQAMVRAELVPYLSRRFGTSLPGCSLTVRFVGIGQSGIDQTLKEHVTLPPDMTLLSQFEGHRVDFTFCLPDDTTENRTRLQQLQERIMACLGDHIYGIGDTSLEECVVKQLGRQGTTLVLVEVGSGGSLAAALDSLADTRQVLVGAYVAPTEDRARRLLQIPGQQWSAAGSGNERAKLLATAAAKTTASDWALAVGQAESDDAGSRYLEIAIRLADDRWECRRLKLRGTGPPAHSRLITQLLDLLRRRTQTPASK